MSSVATKTPFEMLQNVEQNSKTGYRVSDVAYRNKVILTCGVIGKEMVMTQQYGD